MKTRLQNTVEMKEIAEPFIQKNTWAFGERVSLFLVQGRNHFHN